MKFNLLLSKFKVTLTAYGWTFSSSGDDRTIVLRNECIFLEVVEFIFPVDPDIPDFPSQLQFSLKTLIQVDQRFKTNLVVLNLVALSKNIKHKFMKDKSKWILGEPKSKYRSNELPEIYVPYNYK